MTGHHGVGVKCLFAKVIDVCLPSSTSQTKFAKKCDTILWIIAHHNVPLCYLMFADNNPSFSLMTNFQNWLLSIPRKIHSSFLEKIMNIFFWRKRYKEFGKTDLRKCCEKCSFTMAINPVEKLVLCKSHLWIVLL